MWRHKLVQVIGVMLVLVGLPFGGYLAWFPIDYAIPALAHQGLLGILAAVVAVALYPLTMLVAPAYFAWQTGEWLICAYTYPAVLALFGVCLIQHTDTDTGWQSTP